MDNSAVLFLDIDGVLQSHRSALAFGGISHPMDTEYVYLDPVSVALLKDFIHKTSVRVVLHSTWRLQVDALLKLPRLLGSELQRTNPRLGKVASIKDWISQNEVISYAILEDHDLGLPNQILVDSETGLNLTHLREMADVLKVEYEILPVFF